MPRLQAPSSWFQAPGLYGIRILIPTVAVSGSRQYGICPPKACHPTFHHVLLLLSHRFLVPFAFNILEHIDTVPSPQRQHTRLHLMIGDHTATPLSRRGQQKGWLQPCFVSRHSTCRSSWKAGRSRCLWKSASRRGWGTSSRCKSTSLTFVTRVLIRKERAGSFPSDKMQSRLEVRPEIWRTNFVKHPPLR